MTAINPMFRTLMAQYAELHEDGLGDTPESHRLFVAMMEVAPRKFLDEEHDMALELGLIPDKPDYYTNDGEPLYELKGIAERLGINPAQALADMPDCIKENFHTGNVHRAN